MSAEKVISHREFKKRQLEILKASKGQLPPKTINSNQENDDLNPESDVKTDSATPELCKSCNGTKVYKGIFNVTECASCDGTGFDLSNPMAIIKHQAKQLEEARTYCKDIQAKQKKQTEYLNRLFTEKEVKARALEYVMRGENLNWTLD